MTQADQNAPQFQTIQEAIDFYVGIFPKLQLTHDTLQEIRQCLIVQKASMIVNVNESLAWNAAEQSFITGQLAMLEKLISGGKIVTA